MATYFSESWPEDGTFIRYGASSGETAKLPANAPWGRWTDGYLVTPQLHIKDLTAAPGRCWEPATYITFRPADLL